MTATAYLTCPLCEAVCGLAVEHEGGRVLSIRGDPDDPLSAGYICPKAAALEDVRTDPDRVTAPLRRRASGRGRAQRGCEDFEEIGWDEALDVAAERLSDVRERHGADAVGVYVGNPISHAYGAMLFGIGMLKVLGTRNQFSSNSLDALPRLVASYLLYGNQTVLPVPDIDRTDHLLVLGANPAVSNGSVMTAPGAARRIKAIRVRGGRVVVIDPRRTETADLADVHHFIRPGTDALLLLAMVHTVFEEKLERPRHLLAFTDGIDAMRELVSPYPPERVGRPVGIAAQQIRALARDFARAPSAVAYGRMGTSVQELGALASWLIDVLNAITGNLDRPGGSMFARAAIDLPPLAARIGQAGHLGRWKSRVSGLPEFNGELPSAVLAEEIETPGPGQIRALLTFAGNPVLAAPNGRRLARALEGLDFMVSLDIYLNETTRHADLILPASFGFEHDHYPLLHHALAIRNSAKYSPALSLPPPGVRHDWETVLDLTARLMERGGTAQRAAGKLIQKAGRRLGPRGLLATLLRLGGRGVTLDRLDAEPHGVDLGPLEPRLPGLLATKNRRIQLAPEPLVRDLDRAADRLAELERSEVHDKELILIGRRTLRSNNSWMHNSERLVKGKNRCTVLMHPDDAAARSLVAGHRVRVESPRGAVVAELEVSDEIMPGVVSLPHGWGHDHAGTRLRVAREHAGVSLNDITDDRRVDRLSGAAVLNGVPVSVTRAV